MLHDCGGAEDTAVMSEKTDKPPSPAIPDWARHVLASVEKTKEEKRRVAAIKDAKGESTLIDDFEKDD